MFATQRAEHFRILGGVVFQVGVLDDAELARGVLQGGADGRAFAGVLLVVEHADAAGILRGELVRISGEPSVDPSSTATISRFQALGQRRFQRAQDRSSQEFLFVVDRDDDGKQAWVGQIVIVPRAIGVRSLQRAIFCLRRPVPARESERPKLPDTP